MKNPIKKKMIAEATLIESINNQATVLSQAIHSMIIELTTLKQIVDHGAAPDMTKVNELNKKMEMITMRTDMWNDDLRRSQR